MAMTDVLKEEDIMKAVGAFAAPDSLNHKKFFEMLGMKNMSREKMNVVFNFLDKNQDGFIDRDELKIFLRNFISGSRLLTDKEVGGFLKAGDKDGDGKIGLDEFVNLIADA